MQISAAKIRTAAAKNASLVCALCLVCGFCASFFASFGPVFCSFKFFSRNAFLLNLAVKFDPRGVNLEMIYQARVIRGAESVVDIYDTYAICAAI